MKRLGQIVVVTGSMFAGKSEELIRRARRALYAKQKVQVFKPAMDDRYDEKDAVSHEGRRIPAVPVSDARQLRGAIDKDTDLVCIDEAQFFGSEIVALAVELADSGREVLLAGLDQDFRRQPFGPMADLLCAADEVVKLRAICTKCGRPASHTYRTIDDQPAHWNDPTVLIGASERYEARCRACYKIRGTPKPPKF